MIHPVRCAAGALSPLLAFLSQPQRHGEIAMACVDVVLGESDPTPEVVVLNERAFAWRFGASHDGYYRRGTGTVYVSSRRDGTILAYELAHHAQLATGGRIDEAHAEQAARRGDDDTSLRYALRPR